MATPQYSAYVPSAPPLVSSAPLYDDPLQQQHSPYYPASQSFPTSSSDFGQDQPRYEKPSYETHNKTTADYRSQDHVALVIPGPDDDRMPLNSNHALLGFDDQSIRKGFIRKVYGILTFQVMFTCAMCAVFMLALPVRNWTIKNSWMMWVMFALTIVTIFPMMHWRREYPRNIICLGLFTVFQTYTVALVCAIYAAQGNADTVLLAWGLTCIIFLTLTVFTFQSKIDFSFMRVYLSCGLFILILWGIALAILGWRTSFLYSLFGALLFCGYILYDTSNILKRLGPDDYVPAAIELYLDIINLFLFILRLLGSRK